MILSFVIIMFILLCIFMMVLIELKRVINKMEYHGFDEGYFFGYEDGYEEGLNDGIEQI